MRRAHIVTVISLLALLVVVPVFGSTLERQMPEYIQRGSSAEITLTLSGLTRGKLMAFEESMPDPLKITQWRIGGIRENRQAIKTRLKNNALAWEFTPSAEIVTISYTLHVGDAKEDSAKITSTWFDDKGFYQESAQLFTERQAQGRVAGQDQNQETAAREAQSPSPSSSSGSDAQGAAVADLSVAGAGVGTMIAVLFVLVVLGAGGYYMYSRSDSPRVKKK